jgi:hypothetical protein
VFLPQGSGMRKIILIVFLLCLLPKREKDMSEEKTEKKEVEKEKSDYGERFEIEEKETRELLKSVRH